MTDSTQRVSNDSPNEPSASSTESPFGRSEMPPADDGLEQAQIAVDMAKAWVQQHQTTAMLGAFALGAFIGALMRD